MPVSMTMRVHLFPCRTQKLSSSVLTILGAQAPGKIGRRRHTLLKKKNSKYYICLNSSVGFESERCRWQKERTRKGAEKRSDGTEVTARLFLKLEEHAVTACKRKQGVNWEDKLYTKHMP